MIDWFNNPKAARLLLIIWRANGSGIIINRAARLACIEGSTASRHVHSFLDNGLITLDCKGRSKTIYITVKGEELALYLSKLV